MFFDVVQKKVGSTLEVPCGRSLYVAQNICCTLHIVFIGNILIFLEVQVCSHSDTDNAGVGSGVDQYYYRLVFPSYRNRESLVVEENSPQEIRLLHEKMLEARRHESGTRQAIAAP